MLVAKTKQEEELTQEQLEQAHLRVVEEAEKVPLHLILRTLKISKK